MKKFLFTLAALLMAGSAFAWAPSSGTNQNDYFYIDDFEFSETQMANLGKKTVNVHAQFTDYISAFSIKLYLPEGLNVTNVFAGENLVLSYTDNSGAHKTKEPDLAFNIADDGNVTILVSHLIMDYAFNEDTEVATQLGVAHWAPGYYEQMVRVQFQPSAGFAGGDVTIESLPSAGGHVGYEPICPQGSNCQGTFHVGVPAAPQPTALTADITIGDADGLFVPITVTNVNDPDAEIVVTVGETVYPIENGGITLPAYNTDYNVVVTVTAKGEGYTGTVTENKDVHTGDDPTPPAPTALTADITIGDADGLFVPITVTNVNDPDAEIVVTVGETVYPIENGGITLPAYNTDYNVVVTVTAKGEGYTGTVTENKDVHTGDDPTPPAPTALTADITIGDADGLFVPITVTNVNDPDAEIVVTVGETVYPIENGGITLPAYSTDYNVVVTVTAKGEGYTGTVTENKDVHTGNDPRPFCERPSCAYSITALETVTVTITNNQPGATVYWSYVDPVTGETVQGSFTGEQDQIIVDGVGQYTITCYAAMEGYQNSPDGGCFFEILPNDAPPTAIDELVNGKTVAGVRYFNMAGQEMQEANGMTIVVTTYTDGTTSAVKVMK